MRRPCLSVFLLLLPTVSPAAAPSPAEKLHGTWVATSGDGVKISLTFGPQDRVRIRVADQKGEGTYKVDAQQTPAHLDIDWGQLGKVRTVYELTQKGKLRIENSKPESPRPPKLTSGAVELSPAEPKQ